MSLLFLVALYQWAQRVSHTLHRWQRSTTSMFRLNGCAQRYSEGETVEEALKNIREAIELYLESVEDELIPLMAEAVVVEEIEL